MTQNKKFKIYNKREIMDANKFVHELVKLRQYIIELKQEKDYENWVKSTDTAISNINSRIRKSNKKWVPNWKELLEKETNKESLK